MGKNSNFERKPRDWYPTPYDAVVPLLPFIIPKNPKNKVTFIEPCAGDGRLIRHIEKHGPKCVYACDIEPQAPGIEKLDVLFFTEHLPFPGATHIITNPPWERDVMHRMIDVFRGNLPTWLLIDAGWMFTAQAKPYLKFCDLIVSIGRVSWMENDVSGKEDCCWYHFIDKETQTVFYP